MGRIKWLRGRLGGGQIATASMVTSSHFFVAVTTVLQSALLARILPVAELGKLATVLALAAVLESAVGARAAETSLAAFALVRDGSPAQRSLLRYLFVLDFMWSASAYSIAALALLAHDFLTGQSSVTLFCLLFASFISFPWGTSKGYITVFLSARKLVPGEVAYMISTAGVGVLLTYFFGGIGFAIGMILASFMRTFWGLRAIGLPFRALFAKPRDPGEISRRSLWWFGTTGTVRAVLLNGLQQLDILLLASLSGPFAVGLYRPAKTICGIPQRLGQPIWVLLKRHIIDLRSGAKDPRNEPIALTSLALFVIGLIALPGLLFFSERAVTLLFGRSYAPAGQLLWWLLPAAWVLYGVTGWSSTFGSISKRRLTVIGIYLGQLAIILLVTAIGKGTLWSVTIGVAASQVCAAGAFWFIYLADRRVAAKDIAGETAA